ncbi:MAG: maltose/glucose-specific PTS transporter subunit IIC, partial [Vibrionaceae bacterium]
ILDMCSSAAFIILPVLIGFTAAREFGGNPYLGATLGGILTHPALTNAWGVAAGFNSMDFFGIEIAMIGYQGTVFPVLLAVWFMSFIEKQLRRVIPDAVDLILTPFLTVIISGFVALLLIGPAGRMLGDGISFVLSTTIEQAGWLAGLLFGGLYSVIVITGVHHSFHAVEAGLLGNPAIGINFLLPIWAMANIAQGGACLAVWFKTKDPKIKAVVLPSSLSALLGITEAAIFGINMRFVKPFIAALIGGALGGAWVVSMKVYMTAVGLTGIPGLAITQAGSLLNYIIGMVIAFGSAFVISLLLKYKTDAAQ